MPSSTRTAIAVAPTRSAPASTAMPALMSACVVVVVAMVAAINLALPKLSGSSLNPTSTQLLWIVDAYILVFGGLLIPAERDPRRRRHPQWGALIARRDAGSTG